MEAGKNILKLDGPINGRTFFKNGLIIFAYTSFGAIVLSLAHLAFEITRYNIWLFIILWAAFAILLFYTSFLNYTKRIWDIVGDKGNAIFYSIALYIAGFAMGFIPIIKYFGFVFSIIVLLVLLFWKSKLVKIQKKDEVE